MYYIVIVQLLGHVRTLCPHGLKHTRLSSPHNLPEFAQTHSIESVIPSNHLIICHSLLLLPSIFPSIRVLSNELALHIRWLKYWIFTFTIRPSNEYSGLISFRIERFELLVVQGILKSLLQHHSSKAPTLQHSASFIIQLLHLYMTTGNTIILTIWNFVGKGMFLLFNTLSRFVIAFLPRNKCLNFMSAVTISSDFGDQENKVCHRFHFSPSTCHEMMGPDAIIPVFWILNLKPYFSLSSLSLSSRGYPVLLFLPCTVSPAYLKLLIYLLAMLIPPWASPSTAFLKMYSVSKQGDNIHPCHTLSQICTQSIVPRSVLTVASWPVFRFLRRQVR